MQLRTPARTDLSELMTWFDNQSDFENWSGPNFQYPYTPESFAKNLKLNELDSFSFVSDDMS